MLPQALREKVTSNLKESLERAQGELKKDGAAEALPDPSEVAIAAEQSLYTAYGGSHRPEVACWVSSVPNCLQQPLGACMSQLQMLRQDSIHTGLLIAAGSAARVPLPFCK